MKRCFKCGIEKPLSEFYKHKEMADGHLGKCKACTKIDARAHREKNLSYIKAYKARAYQENPEIRKKHKAYSRTERGKESIRRAQDKWLKNNSDKRAAHIILGNAVKSGRILKPDSCGMCGSKSRIHGHHHDYTKPLDVMWCCPKCHATLHNK